MELKFDQRRFAETLLKTIGSGEVPACSICGHKEFATPAEFAAIPISDSFSNLTLGPSVPAGVLVCKKCGHIELFALGVLGLIPVKQEEKAHA